MGQEETIVLHPEDFEDYHKLAAKLYGRDPTQPGRPTKEEQEFRSFLKEFGQFKALKETGLYDQFFDSIHKRPSSEQDNKQRTRKRTRDNSRLGMFSEILEGKFDPLKLFSEETIQEMLKESIVKYGPIIAIFAAWWFAEEFVTLPINEKRKVPIMLPVYETTYAWKQYEPGIDIGKTFGYGYQSRNRKNSNGTLIYEIKLPTGKTKVGEKPSGEFTIERVKVPFPPVLHTLVALGMQSLNSLTSIIKFLEDIGGFEILGDIEPIDLINPLRFIDKLILAQQKKKEEGKF